MGAPRCRRRSAALIRARGSSQAPESLAVTRRSGAKAASARARWPSPAATSCTFLAPSARSCAARARKNFGVGNR